MIHYFKHTLGMIDKVGYVRYSTSTNVAGSITANPTPCYSCIYKTEGPCRSKFMYMSMGLRNTLVVETLRGVDLGQQVQINNVQT